MSKEEEARDEFFEYLLALDSVTRDSKFSPHIEPLESDFWSNLEKDIKEKKKEKEESSVFLDSSELTISQGKPSIHNRVEELGQKVQELEDYVHLVMRGPKGDKGFKGDKGADGVDGADFDLTEEGIKNAVKEGVIEGMKELLSEKI